MISLRLICQMFIAWLVVFPVACFLMLRVAPGVSEDVLLLDCVVTVVGVTIVVWVGCWAILRKYLARYCPLNKVQPCRVAIFMPKRAGEALMATAFVDCLERLFKDQNWTVNVDLVSRSNLDGLLAMRSSYHGEGIITYCRDYDNALGIRETRLDRLWETFWLIIKIRRRDYDIAYFLTGSFRNVLVATLAGIPRRVGVRHGLSSSLLTDGYSSTASSYSSRVNNYLNLFRSAYGDAGLTRDFMPELELQIPEEDVARIPNLIAQQGVKVNNPLYICISPGTARPHRRWAPENFAELAIRLERDGGFGTPFIFTFGPGEAHLKQLIGRRLEEEGLPFYAFDHRQVPLRTLAALYKQALMVISHENTPFTLARVTGTWSLTICADELARNYHDGYQAPGFPLFLYPLYQNKESTEELQVRLPVPPIQKLEVDDLFQRAVARINTAILYRKIDRLLAECSTDYNTIRRMIPELLPRIMKCRPYIHKAIPETIDRTTDSQLTPKSRLMHMERLLYMYLADGQQTESEKVYVKYCNMRRQLEHQLTGAGGKNEFWGAYPLHKRDDISVGPFIEQVYNMVYKNSNAKNARLVPLCGVQMYEPWPLDKVVI